MKKSTTHFYGWVCRTGLSLIAIATIFTGNTTMLLAADPPQGISTQEVQELLQEMEARLSKARPTDADIRLKIQLQMMDFERAFKTDFKKQAGQNDILEARIKEIEKTISEQSDRIDRQNQIIANPPELSIWLSSVQKNIDWWLVMIGFAIAFFGLITGLFGLYIPWRLKNEAEKEHEESLNKIYKFNRDLIGIKQGIRKENEKINTLSSQIARHYNEILKKDHEVQEKANEFNILHEEASTILKKCRKVFKEVKDLCAEIKEDQRQTREMNISLKPEYNLGDSALTDQGKGVVTMEDSSGAGVTTTESKPSDAKFLAAAMNAHRTENWESGAAIWTYLFKESPSFYKDANALFFYGVALSNTGRHDEAADMYEKSVRIRDNFVSAWYNFGVELNNLKRFDEAIKAFKKVTTLDPNISAAWNNLGAAYASLDNHGLAVDSYEKAINYFESDSRDQRIVGIYSNWGRSLYELNDYEGAIENFSKAIKINPKYIPALMCSS